MKKSKEFKEMYELYDKYLEKYGKAPDDRFNYYDFPSVEDYIKYLKDELDK